MLLASSAKGSQKEKKIREPGPMAHSAAVARQPGGPGTQRVERRAATSAALRYTNFALGSNTVAAARSSGKNFTPQSWRTEQIFAPSRAGVCSTGETVQIGNTSKSCATMKDHPHRLPVHRTRRLFAGDGASLGSAAPVAFARSGQQQRRRQPTPDRAQVQRSMLFRSGC